jgi:outer membrane protein assembly factor BamB
MPLRPPLILPLILALLPSCFAQEWPRFRGPNGSGISTETGFPIEFSRTKNLGWRSPVRPGKSSPILTRDRVYVTAYEDKKLYTQCFDRKTGKLLWERSEEQTRSEDRNLLNEPASMTPVTDGENVYVFFADYGLISYDPAGNVRWRAPLGPFTNIMGLASSPVLARDFLIIVADQQDQSYIAAFDRRNGEVRWKLLRHEKDGWATPVVYEGEGAPPHIVTASRGELGAHRADTGARVWTHDQLSPAIVASPVLIEDTLYTFGYGNDEAAPFSSQLSRYDKNDDGRISPDEMGNNAFLIGIGKYEGNRDRIVEKQEWDEKQRQVLAASRLMAVRLERDPNDRSGKSIRPREMWRYDKNFVGVVPSPLVYDGILYLVRNGGILTTFDSATGEVLKTARIPGAIGGYSSSPIAAEGRVYVANEEGKITVLHAGRDWEVLAQSDLAEPCFATPALAGGSIYVRTGEALYCFRAAN